MPIELRPLVRGLGLRPDRVGDIDVHVGSIGDREVVAVQAGIGTAAAASAAASLLDATPLDHVVVVGVAGGVDPAIGIADLVVPAQVIDATTGVVHRATPLGGAALGGTIRTSDEIVTSDQIPALVAAGITALDMETGCIAAACEQRGVPWTAFRSISDRISDGLLDDTVMGMMRPDGSVDLGAAAKVVARRPWVVPRFARMGRWATRAARAAADAAIAACR
jgi:adenosylhomocysteine nucleosidase